MNKHRILSGALVLIVSLLAPITITAPSSQAATLSDPNNTLVATPPMGWNSYNLLGGTFFPEQADCSLPSCIPLNETRIKAIAQAMIDTGLRDKGYVYVNIDDRWQDPRQPRDGNVQLQWDPRRFPSGIPALAQWLHAKGLKLGLYVLPNNRPCGGEEGPTNLANWPSGLPQTGSMGREYIDAQTFANWGVDYLKFDWCGCNESGTTGKAAQVFKLWDQAITASGRNMLVAASTWGWENEATWGPLYANTWRIDSDVYPQWSDIIRTLDKGSTVTLRSASGPKKGWNDFDSMQVGNPGLTAAENSTHFIMWAMENSPLILSNDLARMNQDTADLIGNTEIIAINQDTLGEQAWLAKDYGNGTQVWARSLTDGSKAVALLNRGSSTANITMNFTDIYLGSQAGQIRNLVNHTNLGSYAGVYTATVASHDTVVFKVAPVASQSIEMETGQLTGGAVAQTCATCSGGKNVGYVGGGSGTVTLNVTAASAGTYSISLYFNSGEARSVQVSVNGAAAIVFPNLNSGSWTAIGSYTVFSPLKAGANTLLFSNPSGWAPDLDRIVVAPSS